MQHFKQTARPNNSNWSHAHRQVLDARTNAKRLHRSARELTTMMHTNRQQQQEQKRPSYAKNAGTMKWKFKPTESNATPTPAWHGCCCIFCVHQKPHYHTHTYIHISQSGHCCKCFQWAEITETSFACHEGPSLELFVCDAFFCRLFLSFGPLLVRFKLYLHSPKLTDFMHFDAHGANAADQSVSFFFCIFRSFLLWIIPLYFPFLGNKRFCEFVSMVLYLNCRLGDNFSFTSLKQWWTLNSIYHID